MNRFILILGAVFAMTFLCCKEESVPVKAQVSFKLSSKKGYLGISDITIENRSTGIRNFDWYIDNNFITNATVLSSSALKAQSVNKKHEIKLIGNSNNGELFTFIDSFIYYDSFNFTHVMFKDVSNQFVLDFLEDTSFFIGVSLINDEKLISNITFHTVPKRINILPHIWTKDSFSMYSNKFINRNSMGYNGVSSPIVVPFYLDLQKINQYQLIITKCLKRTKTWLNPFVSIPINGISINEASHTVTFTSTSFEVSVR